MSKIKLRTAFFGTPLLAKKSLEALIEHFNVVLAVTKPDKRRGRGKKLLPTEVKEFAVHAGIPVVTPHQLDDSFVDTLREYNVQLIVLVAYGKILPESIIKFPEYGSVNLHPSLLPELRGASPIQSAILFGLKKTGITLQKMVYEMDAGDIISQVEIKIDKDWSAEDLYSKVLEVAPGFLVSNLKLYIEGKLTPVPQDKSKVTYCYPLKKSDAPVNWSEDAGRISRKIMAFNLWPVCYSYLDTKVLRFFRAYVYNGDTSAFASCKTGEVVDIVKNAGIVVKCGDGFVALTELQLQGKRRMNYMDFINGYRNLKGKVLRASTE